MKIYSTSATTFRTTRVYVDACACGFWPEDRLAWTVPLVLLLASASELVYRIMKQAERFCKIVGIDAVIVIIGTLETR